jgi:non-ribosomal peptide synthetase component F
MKAESTSEAGPEWADDVLVTGPDNNVPLNSPTGPIVPSIVRQAAAAGVRQGACVALRLPPSPACVADLLAVSRAGFALRTVRLGAGPDADRMLEAVPS